MTETAPAVPIHDGILALLQDSTEVAAFVTELIRSSAISDETVRDLRRLLAHDLGRKNTGYLRVVRLTLLADMIHDRREWRDRSITTDEYMAERQRRIETGDHADAYPDEATIRRHYGGWAAAFKVASRFAFVGSPARIPSDYSHAKFGDSYTRAEIRGALLRYFRTYGNWPAALQYADWAMTLRHLARKDQPERLPGLAQISKQFGDFDVAVADTRRWWQHHRAASVSDTASEQQLATDHDAYIEADPDEIKRARAAKTRATRAAMQAARKGAKDAERRRTRKGPEGHLRGHP